MALVERDFIKTLDERVQDLVGMSEPVDKLNQNKINDKQKKRVILLLTEHISKVKDFIRIID